MTTKGDILPPLLRLRLKQLEGSERIDYAQSQIAKYIATKENLDPEKWLRGQKQHYENIIRELLLVVDP